MSKMLLGRKGRMTQIFTEDGVCVPVTLLEAGPCRVTKVCTPESDGYHAVQIGYDEAREKVLTKPEIGHAKKSGETALRHLGELRLDGPAEHEVGAELKADVFEAGDLVDVIGTSKGRGTAGVMKRWDFGGGRMTHGGMARRRPGSIGMSAYPGKVFKGKRMAGHYGSARITVKNLEVVAVDAENNLIAVRGAVPGHRGGVVRIRRAKTGYPTPKGGK